MEAKGDESCSRKAKRGKSGENEVEVVRVEIMKIVCEVKKIEKKNVC